MPYYNAGDYYGRGDYYQAGGLFSGIANLAKKVVSGIGKVASFIPGPVGIAGKAIGALDKLEAAGPRPPGHGLVQDFFAGPPMIAPPAGGGIGIMAPGGGIITQSPLGTPVSPGGIAMQVARMRHTHPNKTTYITRGGGTSRWPQQIIVHPKHTELVPSRRMNVANPRALRRALRRAAGFVKLARRAHVKLTSFRGGGKKRRK